MYPRTSILLMITGADDSQGDTSRVDRQSAVIKLSERFESVQWSTDKGAGFQSLINNFRNAIIYLVPRWSNKTPRSQFLKFLATIIGW